MPPTSAAPTCKGFTFLEVLIAFVVVGVLVAVAGASLITSLRAEETASALGEASFLLFTIQCRAGLNLDLEPLEKSVDGTWQVLPESREEAAGDEPSAWRVWQLTTEAPMAPSLLLALREE